jgi:hypothetical protein
VQTDRELGKLDMRSIVFHHDAGTKVHVRGVRACAPMPPSQDQADAERLHRRSTLSKSTQICITSTPSTASRSAKYVYIVKFASKPICSDLCQVVACLYTSLGIDASPATPRRPRWIIFTNIVRDHPRRQPSTSPTSQHRRCHHRPWSSSTPTKSSTSSTSDAAQLQAENPGLIPDSFDHYN